MLVGHILNAVKTHGTFKKVIEAIEAVEKYTTSSDPKDIGFTLKDALNAQDEDTGETALICAIKLNDKAETSRVVRLLLSYTDQGLDLSLADKTGQTARTYVLQYGNKSPSSISRNTPWDLTRVKKLQSFAEQADEESLAKMGQLLSPIGNGHATPDPKKPNRTTFKEAKALVLDPEQISLKGRIDNAITLVAKRVALLRKQTTKDTDKRFPSIEQKHALELDGKLQTLIQQVMKSKLTLVASLVVFFKQNKTELPKINPTLLADALEIIFEFDVTRKIAGDENIESLYSVTCLNIVKEVHAYEAFLAYNSNGRKVIQALFEPKLKPKLQKPNHTIICFLLRELLAIAPYVQIISTDTFGMHRLGQKKGKSTREYIVDHCEQFQKLYKGEETPLTILQEMGAATPMDHLWYCIEAVEKKKDAIKDESLAQRLVIFWASFPLLFKTVKAADWKEERLTELYTLGSSITKSKWPFKPQDHRNLMLGLLSRDTAQAFVVNQNADLQTQESPLEKLFAAQVLRYLITHLHRLEQLDYFNMLMVLKIEYGADLRELLCRLDLNTNTPNTSTQITTPQLSINLSLTQKLFPSVISQPVSGNGQNGTNHRAESKTEAVQPTLPSSQPQLSPR